MSKRKKKMDRIVVMTSLEATRAAMPKFYPACRCGKHKSKKDYDRKDKSWKDEEWYQLSELFAWFIVVIVLCGIIAFTSFIIDIAMRIWANHISPWLDEKIGPLR